MTFLFSALLTITCSIFIASQLKFRSKIAHVLSLYLFTLANITFTGHLGHFVSLLNSKLFFLTVESIFLLVAFVVWRKTGRPDLRGAFQHTALPQGKCWYWLNLDLILMTIGVSIALGIGAYLWFQVPPNNNDSLSTHMVRVLYWLQHGSYSPWYTLRTWQIIYPVNAQLNLLWTVLFTGMDHWVGLIQWIAGVFSAISVMGIARELKASRTGALFVGLIFLTYPIVALQSTTTQNGLVASALFGISFYYFYRAIQQKNNQLLILSGLSLGIAIGTKQTILFLLPGWGLALLLLWLVYRKTTFRQLAIWVSTMIVSFLLIGSQIFFINLQRYGHPMGPENAVHQSTAATASFENATSQVALNTTRFLYHLTDPSGLPSPLWRWGIKGRAIVGETVFEFLNIPIDSSISITPPHQFSLETPTMLLEDEAWFGLLGFLAIVPTLLIMTAVNFKKKEPISLSIFLITVGFFICDTLLRPGWDPYQGRYFIPVALLCTALFSLWFNHKITRWIMGPFSLLIGLSVLFNSMLFNMAKPVFTEPISFYYRIPEDPGYEELSNFQIFQNLNRNEKLSMQTRSGLSICKFIDDSVPSDAVLGYISNVSYFQEYCYFGETLQRTVIPLDPASLLNNGQYLANTNPDFIFLYRFAENELPRLPNYHLVSENKAEELYLFQRTESAP